MTTLQQYWNNAQTFVQDEIGVSSYQTWFSNLNVNCQNDKIILETPDEFFKTWIIDHYADIIQNALKKTGLTNCDFEIVVSSASAKQPEAAMPAVISVQTASVSYPKNRTSNIQSRFSFENFVMGSSNKMAFRASQAVAENPSKAYNPLFIYGQSGMGKTHLMHAIANQISIKYPAQHCLYITSEQFTNELIEAIKNRSASQFKQKYRNIDVLLIDDIQFIAGKESTQEEFFHTFNELHNSHKQIVMTCDRPAKEVAKLEDRLVTRFSWGLAVDIQPPDFETRVAILRKKIEVESIKVPIPDDVIFFIAEQIKTNIRELEGALIRVLATSLLEENLITLELTRNTLKDMVKETTKTISLEMIILTVADYYKVNISDLKSTRRNQTIVVPRQIGMYLSRKLTKHSLPEIGNAFGGRDHTTVLHSCKKIDADINEQASLRYAIEKLSDILKR
jgi:chromosomal replication initiator protein